jgi:hypothetical protein
VGTSKILGAAALLASGLLATLAPASLSAQGVTEVTITCGESCWTPEERARNQAAERERLRAKAELDRKVDAQLARMGGNPARRAEAERFVRMQEDAQKARAKLPKRQCTSRTWSQPMNTSGQTRDAAFAQLTGAVSRKSGCNIGGSESVLSMSLATAANCSERALPSLKPPPVGTCLACITEKQAIAMGYVPGKGWPPPKKEWVCKATVACAAEKCGSGTSAVSAQ